MQCKQNASSFDYEQHTFGHFSGILDLFETKICYNFASNFLLRLRIRNFQVGRNLEKSTWVF